jgi:hypothetical protein
LSGVEAGGRPPIRARSTLNDEREHVRRLDHLATDKTLKTKAAAGVSGCSERVELSRCRHANHNGSRHAFLSQPTFTTLVR